jgi:hypothetical protein
MLEIAQKIKEQYGLNDTEATLRAEKVLRECPQVLMENVREWVEEKPLTDIYVGKYSLPMILTIWNSRDFLRALEVLNELQEGNVESAELKIWEMRR